jgi:hypothetical protein
MFLMYLVIQKEQKEFNNSIHSLINLYFHYILYLQRVYMYLISTYNNLPVLELYNWTGVVTPDNFNYITKSVPV